VLRLQQYECRDKGPACIEDHPPLALGKGSTWMAEQFVPRPTRERGRVSVETTLGAQPDWWSNRCVMCAFDKLSSSDMLIGIGTHFLQRNTTCKRKPGLETVKKEHPLHLLLLVFNRKRVVVVENFLSVK